MQSCTLEDKTQIYFCNNCGKEGHVYTNCKAPIMSIGFITFRKNIENEIEFLMICRRDTLGFIDFMRGKYLLNNKDYILNMLKQMTINEKERLRTQTFDELWKSIWGNKKASNHYKSEETISSDKFNALKQGVYYKNTFYNIDTLIEDSNKICVWQEPEWGFPKGKRNFQESDMSCALREFTEETGYDNDHLIALYNILPFEEIFTGSNYKSYKHKYYIAYMKNNVSQDKINPKNYEVSKVEWKTYKQCMNDIRYYNVEKQKIITNVYDMLKSNTFFFV